MCIVPVILSHPFVGDRVLYVHRNLKWHVFDEIYTLFVCVCVYLSLSVCVYISNFLYCSSNHIRLGDV